MIEGWSRFAPFRTVGSAWLFSVIALVACDASDTGELAFKRLYSVLQAEEYRLSQSGKRYRYVFKRGAPGTEFDTLAFPSGTDSDRYFVMIANASSAKAVLTVSANSNDQPVITAATLTELVSRGMLSGASSAYLADRTFTPDTR